MAQITTEITSSQIASDNPIHQRLLYAYEVAAGYLNGSVLEVGCGEGRGIDIISNACASYTALDKNAFLLDKLQKSYPSYHFIELTFPPLSGLPDNSFDCVIAFQVIEHIKNDELFIKEIHRVLKPGGKALISTPNILLSLTRNPWHEREYTAEQLKKRIIPFFSHVSALGISGNKKVQDYYSLNKASVRRITRFDILNLQYRLPASVLRIPYDLLNRMNRNRMMRSEQVLVSDITTADYFLSEVPETAFDLFFVAEK